MLQQSELIFDFASDHVNMTQLMACPDYPAVIVEQVPHEHLLSYSSLTCDQSSKDDDQLLKGVFVAISSKLPTILWSWHTTCNLVKINLMSTGVFEK